MATSIPTTTPTPVASSKKIVSDNTAKGFAIACISYFSTQSNWTNIIKYIEKPIVNHKAIKIKPKLTGMFMPCPNTADLNTKHDGTRWYQEQSFDINGYNVFLSNQWRDNNPTRKNSLTIDYLIDFIHKCFGSNYVYKKNAGNFELWEDSIGTVASVSSASHTSSIVSTSPVTPTSTVTTVQKPFSIAEIISLIGSTGLQYDPLLVKRFAFSLMTKPFVILSGLAGSGKTQLALAFAKALIEDDSQMCMVSVGADWTNREPLLGYPNALDSTQYVRPESGVLDLLIEANKSGNAQKPYFLILDEMNMSYVERYFADFLSAMESHEAIKLWNGHPSSPIPESVTLTNNIFIIGTINVDETTYMFSPKVLDRANVIEFKITEKEMDTYLNSICSVNISTISHMAAYMANDFINLANSAVITTNPTTAKTLIDFFKELKTVNAEFGYRSASEIYKYIDIADKNDDTKTKDSADTILDCALVQKLLPKLHGSRKKLGPVLETLWGFCCSGVNLNSAGSVPAGAKYPLTADKVLRMYRSALDNGFTSYSEA